MWKKVAEGNSFDTLEPFVSDRELQKGQRVQVRIQTTLPGASAGFDICPNWGFPAPEGMKVVDVWGIGGPLDTDGIVEMEADPAGLGVVIAFIRAHWLAILIAGAALYLIVRYLAVFIWIIKAAWEFLPWVIAGGLALVGVYAMTKVSPRRTEQAKKT